MINEIMKTKLQTSVQFTEIQLYPRNDGLQLRMSNSAKTYIKNVAKRLGEDNLADFFLKLTREAELELGE